MSALPTVVSEFASAFGAADCALSATAEAAQWVDSALFSRIAADVRARGYSVCPGALPPVLAGGLLEHLHSMSDSRFTRAGVGRKHGHTLNDFVRTDEISWINGESVAGQQWLAWAGALQQHLNRELLLGLFSFESHFAHYGPGDFYRKHMDAFRGEANRVLSLVAYLNPGWQMGEGGELRLFTGPESGAMLSVQPLLGTLVVFLSEEFPHEVLPASRDRYSIAGWFRVNGSNGARVDPPR